MAEKNKKTITGQVLNSIKINKLKCINGLNEIIFKPHALTAILGAKWKRKINNTPCYSKHIHA
ncbi:hypothetical protein WI242_23400 (plasmid) [Salmonella enterica subsp. enterica serovar Infantis]|uniref:hypothetical protein n=1 Tax=Salmonella enterica TaxID=28901 RepID=UPI00311AE52E